jgi:hypothetical protein
MCAGCVQSLCTHGGQPSMCAEMMCAVTSTVAHMHTSKSRRFGKTMCAGCVQTWCNATPAFWRGRVSA